MSSSTTTASPAILNTSVTDTIPAGSSFVADSVTVNGVSVPTASPVTGIPIGLIPVGGNAVITFQLTIDSVPDSLELTDTASASFTFQGNPYTQPSNPATVVVLDPIIDPVKRAGVDFASIGDVINYSVTVTNTGNIAAAVTVTDPLSTYTAFVPGTVVVNGTSVPGADPVAGISAGTIAPDESSLVSYDVQVISVPTTQFITDQATASFTFQSPSGATGSGSVPSNIVLVADPAFPVAVVKSASSSVALVGDVVTYTATVTNNETIPVTNVTLTDSSTPGSQFVPGSVAVNGVPVAGDITVGVNIGTLLPGQIAAVTFQETILFIPQPTGVINDSVNVQFTAGGIVLNIVSNTVQVFVTQPMLSATKQALDPYVFVGDQVRYEQIITNAGSYNATATWFDITPPGSEFIVNSYRLNGVPDPGVTNFTGAFLGTIEANSSITSTFRFQVLSYPPTGVLTDQGRLIVVFTLPDGSTFTEEAFTNPVTVPVLAPPTIQKVSSVSEVVVGSSFIYTITITNPILTPLVDAVLTDVLPRGLQLISGTVRINGNPSPSESLSSGIPLGTIPANSSVTVTFRVAAVLVPTNPSVVNTAQLSFNYLLPSGLLVPGSVAASAAMVIIEEEE